MAADVSSAVEPGVAPGGLSGEISELADDSRRISGRQDAALHGRRDVRRYGRRGAGDFNFGKRLGLGADELAQADQFQQRQEGADDLGAAGGAREQFDKAHAGAPGDHFEDEVDFLADRPFVLENVAQVFALVEALQHAADGVEQVKNGNIRLGRRGGVLKFQFARHAREDVFLFGLEHLQAGGGVLEFLVFHQLADEFPARVFALLLALDLHLLVHRQQLATFDVHERRGHHEKFAGNLQIELPHEIDVFDELRGEFGEVDFVNVHLLLLDQIKEQIERAFEDLELDFVFRHEPKNSKAGAGGWQWRNANEKCVHPELVRPLPS